MKLNSTFLVTTLSGFVMILFNAYILSGQGTNYEKFIIYCLSWLCIYHIFEEDKQ